MKAYPQVDFSRWRTEKKGKNKSMPSSSLIIHKKQKIILSFLFSELNQETIPYWQDAANLRKFFDDYAATAGINPLDSDSWHARNLGELKSLEV